MEDGDAVDFGLATAVELVKFLEDGDAGDFGLVTAAVLASSVGGQAGTWCCVWTVVWWPQVEGASKTVLIRASPSCGGGAIFLLLPPPCIGSGGLACSLPHCLE